MRRKEEAPVLLDTLGRPEAATVIFLWDRSDHTFVCSRRRACCFTLESSASPPNNSCLESPRDSLSSNFLHSMSHPSCSLYNRLSLCVDSFPNQYQHTQVHFFCMQPWLHISTLTKLISSRSQLRATRPSLARLMGDKAMLTHTWTSDANFYFQCSVAYVCQGRIGKEGTQAMFLPWMSAET